MARPGSDPVAPAVGSRDGVVRLLAVGSVVPGKGYDVLIAALTTLTRSALAAQVAVTPDAIARLPQKSKTTSRVLS